MAQPHWYGIATVGQSTGERASSEVRVAGASASTLSRDERGDSNSFRAGYRFSNQLAIEGGYVDLGRSEITNRVTAPSIGTLRSEVKAGGWTARGVGFFPITDVSSLLGTAGVIFATVEKTSSPTGAVAFGGARSTKVNEVNPVLGLGIQYEITKKLSLRAEYESYFGLRTADDAPRFDVKVFGVGLLFKL